MTQHLDNAVERSEALAERLDDTRQADGELRVTEDEIEKRLAKIEEAVKSHNETLQQREARE